LGEFASDSRTADLVGGYLGSQNPQIAVLDQTTVKKDTNLPSVRVSDPIALILLSRVTALYNPCRESETSFHWYQRFSKGLAIKSSPPSVATSLIKNVHFERMKTMNVIKLAIVLAIGVTSFFGSGSGAYAFEQWSMNATSCTPDAASIRNNLYIGTAGTVKFAAGKVGNIVLYCPVPTLSWKPRSIAIQYYDDTAARGNHVTAQFIEMSLGNAIGSGLIRSVVTVDSDVLAAPTTGGNSKGNIRTFVHSYEPKGNAYYIRVDIARNNIAANETIYAVVLQGS
jgi:hypothetical protein